MNNLIKKHPYLYIEQLLEKVELLDSTVSSLKQQIQDLDDRKANKRGTKRRDTSKDSVVGEFSEKRQHMVKNVS